MNLYIAAIRQTIRAFPGVVPHLSGKARFMVAIGEKAQCKTLEFFQSTLERMVLNVYNGNLSGEFIDLLGNLISGQLTQAYDQAWADEGDETEFPTYLLTSLEDMILGQYEHVDAYFRDIINARLDGTAIAPLLSRAELWAHQYDVAYKEAVQLIHLNNGGNLIWKVGKTEQGCSTCAGLDGVVMSAREWQELDVHPRGYPNNKLECSGGGPVNNCDCTLEQTDKRRSPRAYDTVLNIVTR